MPTRRQAGLLLSDDRLGPFQYSPKECAFYYCQRNQDQDTLEVDEVSEEIGKGVFATEDIQQGNFLFEYRGELVSHDEGEKREKLIRSGSFIYFFSFRGKNHCIDATDEDCVGKYANDATGLLRNAFPKVIEVNSKPHIVFFASRKVKKGEEIRYDYGVPNLPWRKKNKTTMRKSDGGLIKSLFIRLLTFLVIANTRKLPGGSSSIFTCKNGKRKIANTEVDETREEKKRIRLTENQLPECPIESTKAPDRVQNLEISCTEAPPELLTASASNTELDVVEDSRDSITSEKLLKPLAEVKPIPHVSNQEIESFDPAFEDQEITDNVDEEFENQESDDLFDEDNDDEEYKPESEDSEETGEEDTFFDENELPSKTDSIEVSSKTQERSDANGMKKGEICVPASQRFNDKRIWDKQHCCVFCMELKSKLPRHFEQVHQGEIEVAKFLALPKKSDARRNLIEELRRKGDFAHNTDVLKQSQGSLILCRRPNVGSKESAGNFIPCENCLGFFRAKDLWRHKKNCNLRKPNKDSQTKVSSRRGAHQSTSAALLPVSNEAKAAMQTQILNTMANDEISMVARTDSLIVQFGTKLFSKTGQEKHQHQYIKQKLRELSRFLITARKLSPEIWSLSDCINPVIFARVVDAVKQECGYDPINGRYRIPSLALKLGHSLKKCARYMKSTALQLQDDEMRKKSEDFKELLDSDWQSEISSQALSTLHNNTFNKPQRLPLTDDIRKLNVFLQQKANFYVEALEQNASEINYQNLSQITQAQLVLFNRRRGGEIERIPVSQYHQGMNKQPIQGDILASLSNFEKKLASQLHRIEIRGKRGRKVPVLFTKQLKKQVDLLIRTRTQCGISTQSNFLFSRVGNCKTPFRSSDALSKFAERCGAEKPKLLQSTNLRFHIGTVSQILNLKENELDILAGFMGHDIRVHRQYYRLPDDTLQLAKVSKILMEMENGCIQQHKGKSLDEIEITEDETLNDDEIREQSTEYTHKDNEDDCEDGYSSGPSKFKGTSKQPSQVRKKEDSVRRPWKPEEKDAVVRRLSKFIRLKKVPGKHHCEEAISQEPALNSRPWKQIKFFVKNLLTSKRGMQNISF